MGMYKYYGRRMRWMWIEAKKCIFSNTRVSDMAHLLTCLTSLKIFFKWNLDPCGNKNTVL